MDASASSSSSAAAEFSSALELSLFKIPLRNIDDDIIDWAFVSEEDYERVNELRWHRVETTTEGGFYAQGRLPDGVGILMHHFVFGKPVEGEVVDHKDHRGLNNTRPNLHSTTRSCNSQNKPKREGCSSQYVSVSFNKQRQKWQVDVKKSAYGLFLTEAEAGKMADRAILRTFGKHAKTNGLLTPEEREAVLSGTDVPLSSAERKNKAQDLPKGVVFRKDSGKYRAKIRFDDKLYELGTHVTVAAAEKAYNDKFKKLTDAKNAAHLLLPIQRNEDGVAVIDIKNAAGDVVAQALVDDNRWHQLMHYSWNLSNGHAVCTMNRKLTKMHKFLMPGDLIMHWNGDDLDNRLANLKQAEQSDINQRRSKKKTANSTSQFRGVCWNKKTEKWEAEIHKDNKRMKLGRYDNESLAALAYNDAALELFEDPFLNVVED